MPTGFDDYGEGRKRRSRPREGMPSAKDAAQAPNLFDEPAKASVTGPRSRTTDPSTSHRAAVVAAGSRDLSDTQRNVLLIIRREGGCTDDEIFEHWQAWVRSRLKKQKTPQRLRTCRADLVKLGYVRDSGRERDSANGNPAVVWEARPRP